MQTLNTRFWDILATHAAWALPALAISFAGLLLVALFGAGC